MRPFRKDRGTLITAGHVEVDADPRDALVAHPVNLAEVSPAEVRRRAPG
jgi:hypothetical protein